MTRRTAKYSALNPASALAMLDTRGPRTIVSAKGCRLVDADGHSLIDGCAGLWCSNLGHGREDLAETLRDTTLNLDYYHTFNAHANPAQTELAQRLVAMAPGDLARVFFGCTGSDANDSAIKLAWYYHAGRGQGQKRKIIARNQGYHGSTLASASLTCLPGFHRDFHLPLDFVRHADCAHYYRYARPGESQEQYSARLADELERLVQKEGADSIAAFIGEPVMGAGGVIPPPEGYWDRVQQLCRKHDILLIADEVVCGFGRTGHPFGSHRHAITPDIMTAAKGLTAGVFPMSATFVSSAVYKVIRRQSDKIGHFAHGFTYSGHPLGAALALKCLDILEQEQLAMRATRMGAHLQACLHEALGAHPHVGEIRSAGLLAGVQIVQDRDDRSLYEDAAKAPKEIAEACYRAGVIVRPLPSVGTLAMSPPLVISKGEIEQMVDTLARAINKHRFP